MATSPSLSSNSLDYDAEVAYVTVTSPLNKRDSRTSEFDFSLSSYQLRPALQTIPRGNGAVPPANGTVPGKEWSVPSDQDQESGEQADGEGHKRQPDYSAAGPKSTEDKASESEAGATQPVQKILVIYGPSGSGKSTLVQKLAQSSPGIFSLVVSHTTRRRREYEINGVDLHFITKEEMSAEIAQGNFIEYVQVSKLRRSNPKGALDQSQLVASRRFGSAFDLLAEDTPTKGGEFFGTSWQALAEAKSQGKPCVILNVSSKGAQQLKETQPNASFIFLHPGEELKNHTPQIQPDYIISLADLERAFSELQQYAYQLLQGLHLTPSSRYQMAKEEWDSLPTIDLEKGDFLQHQQRLVTFNELLSHFQSATICRPTEHQKGGLLQLFSRCKLNKKLHFERSLVFVIAQSPLNDKEPLHLQTLQTIYKKLTGSSINCRRFGSHWQDIGFEGVDPADNLRGAGFLSLMQLVHLLENPRTLPLAREIYHYSTDEAHYVPFCVLSINITQMVLTTLHEGALSKVCNKRDQVFAVLNEFHAATLYHYYQIWKSTRKTVLEVGPLLQEVGQYVKKNTKQVLKDFEQYLYGRERVRDTRQLPHQNSHSDTAFTPLDQLELSHLSP